MSEQLVREYHGHEIVSTLDADGWSHHVDGVGDYETLGRAIAACKQAGEASVSTFDEPDETLTDEVD